MRPPVELEADLDCSEPKASNNQSGRLTSTSGAFHSSFSNYIVPSRLPLLFYSLLISFIFNLILPHYYHLLFFNHPQFSSSTILLFHHPNPSFCLFSPVTLTHYYSFFLSSFRIHLLLISCPSTRPYFYTYLLLFLPYPTFTAPVLYLFLFIISYSYFNLQLSFLLSFNYPNPYSFLFSILLLFPSFHLRSTFHWPMNTTLFLVLFTSPYFTQFLNFYIVLTLCSILILLLSPRPFFLSSSFYLIPYLELSPSFAGPYISSIFI